MVQKKILELRNQVRKSQIELVESFATWKLKHEEDESTGSYTAPQYMIPIVKSMNDLIISYQDYVKVLEEKYLPKSIKKAVKPLDSQRAQKSL